ncbi:MAG: VWA domain-containing protein [Spirochaetaceae bacterium]|jgi:Mg-chelatase subunit ChlD|nr:VWA domain-containing protein [Spirochaetaceae bacterium]
MRKITAGIAVMLMALAPIYAQEEQQLTEVTVGYHIEQVRKYRAATPQSSLEEGATRAYISLLAPPRPQFATIDEVVSLYVSPPPSFTKRKNICFVIDISDSMERKIEDGRTRLDWVKDMFIVLMDQLRADDFLSIVVFDYYSNPTDVIVSPRRLSSSSDRQFLIDQVSKIRTRRGWTDIAAGLEAGYKQIESVIARYHTEDYINRVVLLTDGKDESTRDSKQTMRTVKSRLDRGISTVSTIALTSDADKSFMTQLADAGGGLSLFLDEPQSNKALESELITLVASNTAELNAKLDEEWARHTWTVEANLRAAEGVIIKATDRESQINGNLISYGFNLSDYKSEIIRIDIDLEEEALKNGTIFILSLKTSDSNHKFLFTKDYTISINNPVTVTLDRQVTITTTIDYPPRKKLAAAENGDV